MRAVAPASNPRKRDYALAGRVVISWTEALRIGIRIDLSPRGSTGGGDDSSLIAAAWCPMSARAIGPAFVSRKFHQPILPNPSTRQRSGSFPH